MTLVDAPHTLYTADEDWLAAVIEHADIPALLAALAMATGDRQYLDPRLTPDRSLLVENAGFDEEQLALGRSIALRGLHRLRREPAPTTEISPDMLSATIDFLAGTTQGELVEFLTDELTLSGDAGAPDWQLDDVAPGIDFPVVIIGAGMSGLLMAYRLSQANIPFTVIEKEPEVGGTWLLNTYPGCRVDSASHMYGYSFWESAQWPNFYSSRSVLLEYWCRFADENGLRRHIRFNTTVHRAEFDEERGEWTVTIREQSDTGESGTEETLTARAVVSAVGQLNRPALPSIDGIHDFAGSSFHSAQWRHDVDLTGKRVAIIGTGASAVQIAPEIAGTVGHLSIFQRSAPWLVPTPNYTDEFPDGFAWLLHEVPHYAKVYRFWQFVQLVEGILPSAAYDPQWTSPNASGSAINDQLRALLTGAYALQLPDDPELLAKVIPNYPPITKRMLRDDGSWIEMLKRDNVDLVADAITTITPSGIALAGGEELGFDVIIFATGFTASEFLMPMTVVGRNGTDLHEYWDGDAKAYLGVTVPNFPNLFLMYGPNTNIVVNGSVIFFSEAEAHYIMSSLRSLLASGQRTMEPRQDRLDEYVREIDAANSQLVWGAPKAKSWYKNATGRVSQNWPFSLIEYWRRTREPDHEHYLFR